MVLTKSSAASGDENVAEQTLIQSQIAHKLPIRMRNDTYDKHMAFCNGGRSEDPAAVRSNTMCNMLKAHTKDAHTVCSGTYSKDVERFRKNWSANFVRDVLMSKHKLTPSYE